MPRLRRPTVLLVLALLSSPAAAQDAPPPALLTSPGAQAYDQAGWAVDVDGRRAALGVHLADGATFNTGAVEIFERRGGQWVHAARVESTDPVINENFGESVALEGRFLAVGTARASQGLEFNGGVYVFRRQGQAWVQEAFLDPPPTQLGKLFGVSLDLEGHTLAVGAPGESGGGFQAGRVHVYRRVGDAWQPEQVLDAPGGGRFGMALDLDGARVVAAAPRHGSAAPQGGAAFVFRRVDGRWELEAQLTAPDAAPQDEFGTSVALSGRRLAVGAPHDDDFVFNASGSVYLFELVDGAWTLERKLHASPPVADDFFGRRVVLDGPLLVVSSVNPQPPTLHHAGAAHVFRRGSHRWHRVETLEPRLGLGEVDFASALALDGERLVSGAYLDDGLGEDAGAAHLYELPER